MLLLVVDVVYDFAMLEQDNAFADVDGVLQIVAADENCGTSLLVVFLQQVLDGILATWIEEIEGLKLSSYVLIMM